MKAAALAMLLVAVWAVTGCGTGSAGTVLHVGAVTIDSASVDHWARAIELGSTIDGAFARPGGTPRQKALGFLIAANWAIGAAAERGIVVSDSAVARGLRQKFATAPHGRGEFQEELAATGQTLADVKLEIKAALVAAALRQSVLAHAPPVTDAQIADYYRSNRQRFRIRDRRVVDLIEYIPSYSQAVALGKRLGPGKRFTERAMRELVRHQTLQEDAQRTNGQMVRAIFATPPGRVGGPVEFHGKWVLLVVRKLIGPGMKPLRRVRRDIAERLSGERRRLALANFLQAYRRQWTAKTRCAAGFVVQGCSEYRGRLSAGGSPFAGA